MAWWFFVLQCMYLMMPAYFANMAPVMFKNSFRWLAIPLDAGRTFRGEPLLGRNKTVRGVAMGVLLALAAAFVQYMLYGFPTFRELSFLDYSLWWGIGLLMGAGAMTGDMVKSFVKRRVGISPGKPFIPFDQMDFAVGALLFSVALVSITWKVALTSVAVSVVLHIMVNHLAFFFHVRKEKW